MRTMACSSSKRNSARARARFTVLPTPVGPRKMKAADRLLRIRWRPARLRRIALATTVSALSWPTTRWRRRVLHLDELLHLAFEHFRDGNARPARDDFRDVFFVDFFLQHAVGCFAVAVRQFGELAEFGFGVGDFAVLEFGGALEVALARVLFGFEAELFEASLEFGYLADCPALLLPACAQTLGLLADFGEFFLDSFEALLRGGIFLTLQGGLLDLEVGGLTFQVVDFGGHGADLVGERGGGFVDQVDGLVGEEAVGNVAVRQRGRGDDGGVLDAHLVVGLVALAQAAEDADGVLHVGLADVDDLEAALERGIFLDVLAILVQRGCADGPQASAGKRRLEHVARVHCTFGGAGTDEGVKFVDEENDFAVGVFYFFEQSFAGGLRIRRDTSARRRSCRGEVPRRDDALVFEDFGDVAVDDAAGEAFDDGSFADAGFADEDRVIFCSAGEDLDHAANLFVAADDGVELALAREIGEVFAVLFQGLELGLWVLVGDALIAADGGERFEHGVVRGAEGGEGVAGGVTLRFR